MELISRVLSDLPFPVFLNGIPALEMYYQKKHPRYIRVITTASLIEVAREFDDPVFPGCDFADILVKATNPDSDEECFVAFSCVDDITENGPADIRSIQPFLFDSFRWDVQRRVFMDPMGLYSRLREKRLDITDFASGNDILYIALLSSRLGFSVPKEQKNAFREALCDIGQSVSWIEFSSLQQRYVLCDLLSGPNPRAGFEILKEAGCIEKLWPELYQMIEIAHAKEFHPEGDVWEHTLETFKYRKSRDLRLSLALLLHDVGKPGAQREAGNAFNRHAQIGASIAARFLRRLGFEDRLVEDIRFLVLNHMLPSLISRLPVSRTEKVMASPLFPLLLEVYRCDLSSTFRSPDDYYAACKVYRKFLKNTRNPFRSSEGKKLLRLYVEG